MRWLAMAVGVIVLAGCSRPPTPGFQGYLEGEFVYVGAQVPGRLDTLHVQRGARVEAGAPLFVLERASETAARRQAADQRAAAEARLADLRKGARASELQAIDARLRQARASAELSRIDFQRQQDLAKGGVVSASDFDRVRLTHERNAAAVEDLAAQLETAKLGGRPDAIAAAEAEVRAAVAAAERAEWTVSEKERRAPAAGTVIDTLFRPGEFVPTGSPVVVLLPPENVKLRFFVSEGDLAKIRLGSEVHVALTGRPSPLRARVTFVSPRAEYTPPVLYNRENRAKLVYMIEAAFDPAERDLHPGQPVDVSLP